MGWDASLVQVVGEELGDLLVPVDYKDLLRPGGEVLHPLQKVVPVGVGGQALEVDDLGPDGDILAKELDRFGPLQQPPAQGALPLIAHEHHGALGPPEVVLQVVADAAGVAHAGGGDDNFGGLVVVEGPGLLGALGEGEAGEGKEVFAPLNDGDGFVIQIALQVAGVDLGGLRGQGGVHIYLEAGQGLNQPVPLDLPQVVEQLLGSPYREGGNDDIAAFGEDLVDEVCQSPGVALRGFVIPVAVSGLHDHIVGLVHQGRVADDGLVLVAQVAGEYDFFGDAVLCGPDFHRGGAQKMTGVVKADLNALTQIKEPAILHRLQHVDGLLGVHQGV